MRNSYITSERFIHDELLRRAETGLSAIRETWRKQRHVDPFLISWPSEHIDCDDGAVVTDFFLLELPEDRSAWSKLMVQAVRKTKPYAILLAEELEDVVLLIFESNHGSRSWRYPIKPHGNVRVLGNPKVQDDVDAIGILWRRKTNEA